VLTRRTLPALAFISVAALGLAACAAVNEVVTDRDLSCEGMPDEQCVRIADFAMLDIHADVDAMRGDRVIIRSVTVEAKDCPGFHPLIEQSAKGCWLVGARFPDGYSDIPITGDIPMADSSRGVYERPDGRLALLPD
jgi:hypothetical protein